ncbi:MAG: arginine--tRNA ligase, partial [Methanobacteriota archaeon]
MYIEEYARVKAALRDATGVAEPDLTNGGDHADLASTVAFELAKRERRPPVQIATDLATKLAPILAGHGTRVERVGPYINFHFGPQYLADTVRAAQQSGFGSQPRKDERIVLEHTSANPNGPLHVGHIRNSIIGDTLARAFRKAGYPLDVHYYVNDMGRQIAIVVYGVEHEDAGQGSPKGDHRIARLYIAANRTLEARPEIEAEIGRHMQLVESGDRSTAKKFRDAVSECLDGIKETLAALNVS